MHVYEQWEYFPVREQFLLKKNQGVAVVWGQQVHEQLVQG